MPNPTEAELNAQSVWDRVASLPAFRDLMRKKKAFIIPAFIFFIVYYFALPVLVGYAPRFMARKVWGNVNIAYLFALSQFLMAWILAWVYVRKASHFDKLSRDTIEGATKSETPRGGA